MPEAPSDEPKATDQVNFTDEESRIMPLSGGGFEQAYNAQATVDMDSRLIITNHVTQNTNDKREVEPMLRELALPGLYPDAVPNFFIPVLVTIGDPELLVLVIV